MNTNKIICNYFFRSPPVVYRRVHTVCTRIHVSRADTWSSYEEGLADRPGRPFQQCSTINIRL